MCTVGVSTDGHYGPRPTAYRGLAAAVEAALVAGYRHIDTAACGNEREVGEAIRRSGLGRPEVFVETRV